jgi:Outer membrane protein beta-barrel domain
MKKAIILLTFSIFAMTAMAQVTPILHIQRGNFVIGSRVGFSAAKSSIEVNSDAGSIKGDGGSSFQFNLAPGIGYFFVDNLVLGIGMDWLKTESKTGVDVSGAGAPPQKASNNNVLFGPFLRYFIPAGDDTALFLGTSLGFGNSNNEFTGSDNVTQSINTSLFVLGVGPGITIFNKNGFALEALVKYNFAKSDSEIDIQGLKRTSESWTNAVDFSVGLQYYFGGFNRSVE